MSVDNPEEDAASGKQTVADPEEFNQQRRLRSIHDARDRAREVRELTQDPTVDADHQTLASIYRAAVENYVGEIEGLLRRYEFGEDEHDYWLAYPLGPVEIPPPPKLTQLRDDPSVVVIGDHSLKPIEHTMNGLKRYLDVETPFRETFALPVKRKHKGQQTVSMQVEMPMPINVSYRAHRAANQFLPEIGLGVELEESGLPAIDGFDQSGDSSQGEYTTADSQGDPRL